MLPATNSAHVDARTSRRRALDSNSIVPRSFVPLTRSLLSSVARPGEPPRSRATRVRDRVNSNRCQAHPPLASCDWSGPL